MTYITSNGSFAGGTSGNDIIEATSNHDCLYGGAGNDTFLLSASVMSSASTANAQGHSELGICDFHGGGAAAGGMGEQDFIALRGFSDSATLNLTWENAVDSSGGRYLSYSIYDNGTHYDFNVYSTNGQALQAGLDYGFYHG